MRRIVRRRLALVLIGLAASCKPSSSTTPVDAGTSGRAKIRIFATGDIGSDTDVCGCKVRRMGSVTRRAKVIADRKTNGALVVDAGDLFFRNWSIPPRYDAQARATARFHADTLAHFGAPAMAVGERDLAMGLMFLRGLAERGGVKMLSANLRHTASGTTAFDAYTIVERGGVKIGLVGASPLLPKKAQAYQVYQRAGLVAEPPAAHVHAAAEAARAAGAELVVALLHLSKPRARQVLDTAELGLIDMAIVGHDRLTQKLALSRDGRNAFIMAGDRGKWLAVIDVEVAKGAKGVIDIRAVREQAKQVSMLDERIAAYTKVDPKLDAKTLADRAATLERLKARKLSMEKDLATVRDEGRHRIDAELVPLDADRPEDPVMLEKYRAYQDRLHVVNTGKVPPSRADLTYSGTKSCQRCHEAAFTHWKTTKHAHAWATMKKTRQTANLDCVPCHVTGFDRPGGPRRISQLGPFVDVGCEACHGPGSAHVENPIVPVDYLREVPEKVCAECHRAQGDQKPFVFEDRLPKVLGKGHGKLTSRRKASPKR